MNSVDFIDIIEVVTALITFLSLGISILANPRKGGGNRWIDRIDKNMIPLVILILMAGHFDMEVIRGLSLISIAIILFYNFIYPLFFNRNVKGYNKKIVSFFDSQKKTNFIDVVKYRIENHFFSFVFTIVIATYFFGFFVNLLGYQNAKNQEIYDVAVIEEVTYILFNVNDSKVIAVAVENNILSNEYSIYSTSDLLIKKEKIENLTIN